MTLPAATGMQLPGVRQPDEILAALADPRRRSLLEELARGGEATATSLARNLPITRQAVVKHLAVLSHAGLVSSSRRGREVRFTVQTAGLTSTAEWMAGLAAEWDRRLAVIKRLAETDPDS